MNGFRTQMFMVCEELTVNTRLVWTFSVIRTYLPIGHFPKGTAKSGSHRDPRHREIRLAPTSMYFVELS
jgi:hypothetical protein